MPVTGFHSRTATGADDPSYDVQLQRDWNAAHLMTLSVNATEISALFSNKNGVSFGLDGTNITGSIAAGGAPGSVSAGTTRFALGEVVFSNSNGISFGLDGATVTGTVQTNYLTTGALSNHSHGASGANGSFAFQTLSFSNVNGISFGTSAGPAITASHNALTSQSNQNVTAGNGGFAFQTLSFSNANNFSFGTSAGSAITGSYTVPTVTNSSWTVSDAATSGTVARLAFTNLNGVTLSLSSGAGGSHTIVGSHNALTSQSNQAASASNGSFTFQTLGFSNANNVTFGTSAGSIITASVAAGGGAFTGGMSNIGNTAGTTGTVQSQMLVVGGPNITVSQSINGASATLSISGNAPGAAAENNWHHALGANTAGNTTASGSTIGLSGINLTISGTNDSVLNLSVPATSSIVGTNGISISTAGSTISVMPQWISSYENFEGLVGNATLTFNAASISYGVAFNAPSPISASFLRLPVLMTTNSTTIATLASATASASAQIVSTWNAVVYSLGVGANSRSLQSVASGSAGFTFSQRISITNSTQYSISQGFSAQALGAGTTRTTQYSVSNTNYSFTTNQIATEWSSNRFIDIPFANSLSPGAYWGIFGLSTSSASGGAGGLAAITNCNVRYSNHYGASQTDLSFGVMGSTNRTSGGALGAGSFSTAGGGTTNSLPLSAISSNSNAVRMYFQMMRSA